MRTEPNIIITGTPGVGKSSHSELVAKDTGLKHLVVNKIAQERGCVDGKDEELGSWIVDEDKLLDAVEPDLEAGGCVVDWHACDLFPERLIDLVVVLRCDNTALYDRLAARKYGAKKIEENVDAEIMQVLLDEARDAFDEAIVVELQSSELDDIDANVERIVQWVRSWRENNGAVNGEEDAG